MPAERPVKARVAVIGGGQNCEHEVSLASAAAVALALEHVGYQVVRLTISTDGTWLDGGVRRTGLAGVDALSAAATLSFRWCTARTVRTVPLQRSATSRVSPASARACARERSRWTNMSPSSSPPTAGSLPPRRSCLPQRRPPATC